MWKNRELRPGYTSCIRSGCEIRGGRKEQEHLYTQWHHKKNHPIRNVHSKALGIENETGSIEENKKANLIIWESDSLEHFRNFNLRKIIVKDGRCVNLSIAFK